LSSSRLARPLTIACLAGLALTGAPRATASEAPCERVIEQATVRAQQGPRCLVASAVSAAAASGVKLDARALARAVPLYPDGADVFDIQEALVGSGIRSLTFQTNRQPKGRSGAESIGRLVWAGWPVIAMVHRGPGKHAVVVRGARREARGDGCGGPVTELQVMDPATGTLAWTTAGALERRLYAGQLLVLAPPTQKDERQEPAIDWTAARAENARFRAQALTRRALEHEPLNRQSLTLARRAVQEDPCWPEARALYTRLARRFPQNRPTPPPACPKPGPGD
jgi:hypothetical protein